eukprot:6916741-Lingulodinium_polyedra.AAC.1
MPLKINDFWRLPKLEKKTGRARPARLLGRALLWQEMGLGPGRRQTGLLLAPDGWQLADGIHWQQPKRA